MEDHKEWSQLINNIVKRHPMYTGTNKYSDLAQFLNGLTFGMNLGDNRFKSFAHQFTVFLSRKYNIPSKTPWHIVLKKQYPDLEDEELINLLADEIKEFYDKLPN